MPENNVEKQTRAMITIALSNLPDEEVVKIKGAIEISLEQYPDAVVDLRIGSARRPPMPPT